ncbi:MAG TPA: type II secretion system protein GspJ [Planctomycetota bacterium]|nr:type II secretion system protein GspJ [Planctomycetota bacterium]
MKPRRNPGFTLIEVMLAILLLAIMMSIVYGVVLSTVAAARRVEEITAASEVGPAILTRIRADLEAAFLPKEGEFFAGIKKPGSGMDRDRIDFISSELAYGSENDVEEPRFHSVNEVGYQVLTSPKDPNFGVLYRREDFFIDAEPLKGGHLVEMYDRVKSFSLRYYDGKDWRPDWSSVAQKGLPKAVEIELKIWVSQNGDPSFEQSFKTTVVIPR